MRIDQFRTIESWIAYVNAISDPRPYIHKDSIWHGGSYYGKTPLGQGWGIVYVYVSAAGNILEDSNWEVLLSDLESKFGESDEDQFVVEYVKHWVTGLDYLMIKLIDKDHNPTEIAQYMFDTLNKLADYPVLDESDWSNRESEAQDSALTESLEYAANSSDYCDVINQDSLISFAYQNFDREISDSEGWLSRNDSKLIVDQYVRKVMGYEFMGI